MPPAIELKMPNSQPTIKVRLVRESEVVAGALEVFALEVTDEEVVKI
jgi:hypothetical protein